jgi:hypothetical protein
MICPLLSKVVTSPIISEGIITKDVRHDLFPIECYKKDCAMWTTKETSDLHFSRCGLINPIKINTN